MPLADKDLAGLDKKEAQRVRNTLESVRPDPKRFITALKAEATLKIRAGPWRVFVDIDHTNKKVIVLRVRHREEAYLQHHTNTRPSQS
jgi:mRNA-degrading endonuclease RelE of RelBE toxin-antitoxin system